MIVCHYFHIRMGIDNHYCGGQDFFYHISRTLLTLYNYSHGGYIFGICNITMDWVYIAWPSPLYSQLLFFQVCLGVLKFII